MIGFHITDGLAEKGKLGFVDLGVFGLGLVEALLGLVINRPVLLNIADVLDRVIELFNLLLVGGDLVKRWSKFSYLSIMARNLLADGRAFS